MCWDPLYPVTFPPPGGPLALGFCLRVVRCGSLVGTRLPSDFLPVLCGLGRVARWNLHWARSLVGCHPSRAGVMAHRLGWPPWDGVSSMGDPTLAVWSWVLLGGCSRLQDCPQTLLEAYKASGVPWLPDCSMVSSPAPGGWKRLAGMAGDISLPPGMGGKVPHCSTGKRPWGCLELGVATRVSEEPPWAGAMTYGKKYLAEMKFLVELWEVLAELNQGLGRSGGQRPCTGEGKPLSCGLGLPVWWCVPSGCHLPGCVLVATAPQSCTAPGALLEGLLRLEKRTPKLTALKHDVEAARDLDASNKTKTLFSNSLLGCLGFFWTCSPFSQGSSMHPARGQCC